MKALIFSELGDPNEVLQLEELEDPIPGSGEVLLQVLFSPVNPSDLHMIRGRYGYQPDLPASPGAEGVAVVVGAQRLGGLHEDVRANDQPPSPQRRRFVLFWLGLARHRRYLTR